MLAERCIRSAPDNRVDLAPVPRNGATAIAAEREGREGLGIEQPGESCANARRSVEEARKAPAG